MGLPAQSPTVLWGILLASVIVYACVGVKRFDLMLQGSWFQVSSSLNSLRRVYTGDYLNPKP